MHFLATTLASWQAPADDADTAKWVERVEASVQAHEETPLDELVSGPFLDFLDEAFARLATIYHRVLSMAPAPPPPADDDEVAEVAEVADVAEGTRR
jgi:hypothetical protein